LRLDTGRGGGLGAGLERDAGFATSRGSRSCWRSWVGRGDAPRRLLHHVLGAGGDGLERLGLRGGLDQPGGWFGDRHVFGERELRFRFDRGLRGIRGSDRGLVGRRAGIAALAFECGEGIVETLTGSEALEKTGRLGGGLAGSIGWSIGGRPGRGGRHNLVDLGLVRGERLFGHDGCRGDHWLLGGNRFGDFDCLVAFDVGQDGGLDGGLGDGLPGQVRRDGLIGPCVGDGRRLIENRCLLDDRCGEGRGSVGRE
jgi:hypothetical protein